jgi:hypothetical protein
MTTVTGSGGEVVRKRGGGGGACPTSDIHDRVDDEKGRSEALSGSEKAKKLDM